MSGVLVIDIDDVGREFFDECLAFGYAPRLAELRPSAREYVRWWAAPICSVFRARLLTGLDAYRPGNLVGRNVVDGSSFNGPVGPWYVDGELGRATMRGKWHLADDQWPACVTGPGKFYEHTGSKGNLPTYYSWQRGASIDGGSVLVSHCSTFATNDTHATVMADLAAGVDLIHASFNAIHAPLQTPPANEPPGAVYGGGSPAQRRREMMLHLDWRLGSIIDEARARGFFVFLMGDNGTAGDGKATFTEDGLCTPFLVWGPGVAPGISQHMVQATDLWATVRRIRGLPFDGSADSFDFLPDLIGAEQAMAQRRVLTCDWFDGLGVAPDPARWIRAVRDARWKLIDNPLHDPEEPAVSFFDLVNDPGELINIEPGAMNGMQAEAFLRLQSYLPTVTPDALLALS